MLTANINLVVPDLPDNAVWWANAAAWSNYWKDINLTASFNPAPSAVYNIINYDGTINFVQFNVDGNMQSLPSLAQFNSLVAAFNALQADYILLKTLFKNTGFITEV